MSVFLRHFIDEKKYILISVITLIVMGFLFGFYQYNHSSNLIKDFFKNLFYLNIEGYENDYQSYLILNIVFIFVCTYLSSSYIGHIGILFLLFLKGVQISYSCIFTFSNLSFSYIILLLVFLETVLEILLCITLGVMNIHISLYVTLVTFFLEQNFNMKSMLNYKLNCLILSLIIFVISLAFRLYIIPFF